MSNEFIVVESGVIQCEHGAPVDLNSTVPKHVIGGEKPLFNKDILQADVVGCPHRSSKNGQCKKVVVISSATTESNVSNAGGNYLLRVDGCKTDNGSALVLVDPGQANSKVPVKSSGSAGKITSRILEDAVVENPVSTEKKEYHIYPLRESSKLYRPLRGARDFNLRKDFYHVESSHYSHEKIVTMTQAYLYVTYDDETKEYKVINNGNLYDPDIQDISYEYIPKDSTTKVERGYIPFPKEAGEVKIVYSNLRLTTADVANFKPEIINIGSTKKYHYVNDPQDFSKSKKHTQKSLKNTYLSQKEAKELDKKHFNVVVYLQDPVGEVEDLYNDYEFAYHRAYGMNKSIIDDIRVKNQYPYAVADMLDYLYVSEEDKEASDEHIAKLKKQYNIMRDIVMKKFLTSLDENTKKDMKLNLGKFLNPEYPLAKEYLDEVKFISKSFFGAGYAFDLIIDNERYLYNPQGVHVPNNNNTPTFKPLMLSGKYYTKLRNHPLDALALIVFSFCYSRTYEVELSKFPELVTAREEFYYLLKTAKPLPQINDKSIENVTTELKGQTELTPILNRENPFLDEFESLETKHREYSFKGDTNYSFKSLLNSSNSTELFVKKNMQTPLSISKNLINKLKSEELEKVLTSYKSITSFKDEEQKLAYYRYALNLTYMLSAPRAELDLESEMLSMFNPDFKALQEWVIYISKGMDGLSREQAIKLHAYDIKEPYIKALFSLIGHALVGKDEQRRENAITLLDSIPITASKVTPAFHNIHDHNQAKDLKVKAAIEELYEKLKKLNGFSSKFPDFDGKLKDGAFGANAKSSSNSRGSQAKTTKKDFATKWLEKQKNKQVYINSLSTTKALAGIMTFMSIGEYAMKGKTEKIKIHNIVGLMNDTIALTTALSEQGAKSSTKSVSSLSKFINKGVEIDKVSYKLLAKIGAVGVMFNTFNEISEMDKDDTDGKVSVFTKNAVVIAFLLTPGWAAVVGIVIIEVAWLFLKDYVVDTPLEVYLRKNLFFDAKIYHDNLNYFSALFNPKPPEKSKLAPILLDTIHSEGGEYIYKNDAVYAQEIKGFSTIKEIREFIADNADVNANEIEVAMNNELNTLKQVLYGYKVEVHDTKVALQLPMDVIYFKTTLLIPKEVLERNRHILFYKDKDKKYEEISEDSLGENGDNYLFDTAKDIPFTTIDALQDREDEKLAFIVVNDDITLKYQMQYHADFKESSSKGSTLFAVDEFKNVKLSTQDLKHIKTLK